MKKDLDLLIVARPDQSLQIYNALLNQNSLSFLFLSYKIFPQWVKVLTRMKKMTTVTKGAVCSWRLTFINFCRYKLRLSFAQKWDETKAFDSLLKKIFKKNNVRLIHYWPEYGDVLITDYIRSNPNSFAIADVHMPHPRVVYEEMKSIYENYGVVPESTQLYDIAQNQGDLVENANYILAPSSYVVDTYRQIYPKKKYYVVSYGVMKSPSYEKKSYKRITDFVYAGRISVEKGSDLLLSFFKSHPELSIHLYGNIASGQEFIFTPYLNIPNIHFHGVVPKTELQNCLKQYDVGIHLSRFDAYSLAVGEMIGVGLPVIVSNNTGNKDDIEINGLGLVTNLSLNDIEDTVSRIQDSRTYNEIIENIENYIRKVNVPYGIKIIEFYSKLFS